MPSRAWSMNSFLEPSMLEIERKFLLKAEPITWPEDVMRCVLHIVQSYLIPEPGFSTERVRVSFQAASDKIEMTHTKKLHVSDGVNEEVEDVIDPVRLRELVKRMDTGLKPVQKTRAVFTWKERTFELDSFTGAHQTAPGPVIQILEVELPTLEDPLDLPPWIPILREVTGDRRYSNRSIAEHGLPEERGIQMPRVPADEVDRILVALRGSPCQLN